MPRVLEDLRRLTQLPSERRRRLLPAASTLALTALRLRFLGYAGTRRRLETRLERRPRAATGSPLSAAQAALAEEEAWAMRACAARLPFGSCLERSVALWWRLRCRGIDCRIRFGGRGRGDGMEAHAWLELEGRSLSDPAPPDDGLRELRSARS
jgi:hypothetical protein